MNYHSIIALICMFIFIVYCLIQIRFGIKHSRSTVTIIKNKNDSNPNQFENNQNENVNKNNSTYLYEISKHIPTEIIDEKIDEINKNFENMEEIDGEIDGFCVHGHQLPNIILIQAQKCGTTTFGTQMFKMGVPGAVNCNHQIVWHNKACYDQKEPHFFDRVFQYGESIEKNRIEYAKLFPKCGKHLNVADLTPVSFFLF